MEKTENLVKVGSKPVSAYVQALLYSVDNFDVTKVRGLGNRQQKVLEIKRQAEEINGIEIRSVESVLIDGAAGVELVVVRRGGR